QELPGCSNPSEPFVGASQGCGSSWSVGDWAISNGTVWGRRGPRQTISLDGAFARGPRQTISLDGSFARGSRQTISLDGTFNRGPRQTTSLDGTFVNPETGSLSVGRKLNIMRGVAVDDSLWYLGRERGPALNPEPTYSSAL